MTIIGIGIDIIQISRIERIVHESGAKLAKKILSKKEFNEYLTKKNKINFLAKRFAAKEASSKAFGTGMRNKITFNNFEVYHDYYGSPKLLLLHQAKILAKNMGIQHIHINLTDEKKYACAIVIFEN